MENHFFIAIVGAVSAMFGSVVTTVASYIKTRSQQKHEIRTQSLELRRQAYEELLVSLQCTMNQGSTEFHRLQESILRVSLYGDKETAEKVDRYYASLTQNNTQKLTAEEHKNAHLEIINSMRKNLSLGELRSFAIFKKLEY